MKEFFRGMVVKFNFVFVFVYCLRLLIVDEVISGLDFIVRWEILFILEEYVKKENMIVILFLYILSDLE